MGDNWDPALVSASVVRLKRDTRLVGHHLLTLAI